MRSSFLIVLLALAGSLESGKGQVISVLTKSGETIEGPAGTKSVQFGGRPVALKDILSIHTGDEASARESERISASLAAAMGADRKQRDAAIADLVDIGLPVLTPLLKSYKDSAVGEPAHYYRLFERIITGTQDGRDRTADLARMANGQELRGEMSGADLTIKSSGGEAKAVKIADIRRLAVRRAAVERTVDVHALHHSNQIEFLDTGIGVTADSKLESAARGFVRLSWNDDSWTSDPDGLKKPGGNYKTNLFEGHPFGALLARTGPAGELWVAGAKASKSGLTAGRLYFAINDNRHWQNNLGSYRLTVKVTNAYDLGGSR